MPDHLVCGCAPWSRVVDNVIARSADIDIAFCHVVTFTGDDPEALSQHTPVSPATTAIQRAERLFLRHERVDRLIHCGPPAKLATEHQRRGGRSLQQSRFSSSNQLNTTRTSVSVPPRESFCSVASITPINRPSGMVSYARD